MTYSDWVAALGWMSLVTSGLAATIGLVTIGYLLRVHEERREQRKERDK